MGARASQHERYRRNGHDFCAELQGVRADLSTGAAPAAVHRGGYAPRLRRSANGEGDVLITTMNDIPGWEIQEVIGEVFGLTVRSRHVGADIGASLKSLVG